MCKGVKRLFVPEESIENQIEIAKKRRRISVSSANDDIPTMDPNDATTELTDLNFDCLEKVFNHLDIVDLLNLADSNVRLRKIAAFVFARKHAKKTIHIFNVYIRFKFKMHLNLPDRNVLDKGAIVQVADAKSSLQILRCFGNFITKLVITQPRGAYISNHIIGYANEYCADKLNEIKFECIEDDPFEENLLKPFAGVRKVEFNFCHLRSNIMDFNKWFPKMSSLRMYGNRFVCNPTDNQIMEQSIVPLKRPQDYIEAHCPHLTTLKIDGCGSKPFSLTKQHIERFIDLNPQITQLTLYYCPKMEFLQELSTKLTSLESLDILCDVVEILNYTGKAIEFNVLKYLKLKFIHSYPMPELPFLCNKLETFNLYVLYDMNDELFDFLGTHTTIKKLTLRTSQFNVTDEFTVRIARSLPLLEELDLDRSRFSNEDIGWMLSNLASLKIVHSFQLRQIDDVDTLPKHLNNEWEACVKYRKCIKLARKSWTFR